MNIAPSSLGIRLESYSPMDFNFLGKTLYVGGSGPGNYSKIQYGIDNASSGDTVFVYSGSYFENVKINKSISLIGEDKTNTIIEGRKKRDVIQIVSSNVLIKDFTLNNSGQFTGNAGIQLDEEIESIEINNNILTNNVIGIALGEEYFYDTITHVSIENNFLKNERFGIALYIGYETKIANNTFIDRGIIIPYGFTRDNTVVNNTLNGLPLLYLEKQEDIIVQPNVGQIILVNCDNITVTDHSLDEACFIGIQLYGCSNCNIFKNFFSNKAWSIFSLYSEKSNIQENVFENNTYAIYLKNSDRSTISSNNINNSRDSIHLYHSDRNTITKNNLTNSRTGIDLSHSSDNSIFQNKINYIFDHGIDLFFGCFRNKFFNNTIKNCLDAGIYILGSSSIWWDLASNRNVISGNHLTNNEWGVLLEEAAFTTVSYNNIYKNDYGVEVISAKYNKISHNNIFENRKEDAFFKNSIRSIFISNFWNESKRIHKINGGIYTYNYWGETWELVFKLIRFDWNPAKEPFDI
jgi:parallel beta-helix repeat protein